MSINPDSIAESIKRAGPGNARVQSTGDPNKYTVEVCELGTWRAVSPPLSRNLAEDLIKQGSNRVILG